MAVSGLKTLGGGLVGAGLGFLLGGPTGAAIGFSIGASLAAGFEEKTPIVQGRVTDYSVSGANFGDGIARIAGSIITPGVMIWTSGLLEKKSKKKEGGGLFSSGTEVTTFKYFLDVAFMVCEGPIEGIPKIWMNGKLVYNTSNDATALDLNANGKLWDSVTIYTGDEAQLPDALIESYEGAGNVPAHRGYSYVVFERLRLLQFYNKAPTCKFLVANGTAADDPPNQVGATFATPQATTGAGKLDNGTIVLGTISSVSGGGNHLIQRLDMTGVLLNDRTYELRRTGTDTRRVCKNDPEFALLQKQTANEWTELYYKGELRESVSYSGAPAGPLGTYANQVYFGGPELSTIHIGDYWITVAGTSSNHIGLIRYIASADGGPTMNWDKAITFTDLYGSHTSTWQVDIWADQLDPGVFWVARNGGGAGDTYYLAKVDINFTILNTWAEGIPPSGNNWNGARNFHAGDHFMFKRSSTSGNIDLYEFDSNTTDSAWTLLGSVSTFTGSWSNVIPLGINMVMGRQEIVTLDALVAAGVKSLEDTVDWLLDAAGYAGADYDMTGLTGDVRGLRLPVPQSARESIAQLQLTHYFDLVEVDYQVTGVMRGGAVAAVIPVTDMAAARAGEALPDLVTRERSDELELARSLTLNYPDAERNYEPGSQYARREVTNANAEKQLTVNEALTKDDAAQACNVLLYLEHHGGEALSIRLTEAYQKLVPTDVITITDDVDSVDLRLIEETENPGGIIDYLAEREYTPIYTQAVTGADALGSFPTTIAQNGPGELAWLDIPILIDNDNDLGVYAGVAGYLATWMRHDLYKYSAASSSYNEIFNFVDAAGLGFSEDTLADWTSGVIDYTNDVTVRLVDTAVTLASTTEALAVADGSINRAALGKAGNFEIFQFITATSLGSGRYTLSGLIRARRGTNYATDEHAAADLFVMLDPDSIGRLVYALEDVDTEILHKLPGQDEELDLVASFGLTFTGRALLPFAPANVEAALSGSDWVIDWIPRTRLAGAIWANQASVTDPEIASYTVDFVDGSDVVQDSQTVTVGTETFTWTLALQNASGFGGAQTDINVVVYQKGTTLDTEGHGHKLSTATGLHTITDPKG